MPAVTNTGTRSVRLCAFRGIFLRPRRTSINSCEQERGQSGPCAGATVVGRRAAALIPIALTASLNSQGSWAGALSTTSCQKQFIEIEVDVPTSSQGTSVRTIDVLVAGMPRRFQPTTAEKLAVFSPGFLVQPQAYLSYLDSLACSGFLVVSYYPRESALEPLDDMASAAVLSAVMDWVESRPTELVYLWPAASPTPLPAHSVLAVGHSRGGKTCVLAAVADQRIGALALIDPADGSYETQGSPGFTSSLPRLATAQLPVLVLAAGRSADCIPRRAAAANFYAACRGPAAAVTFKDAGHFQFLDQQSSLQLAVCGGGRLDEALLRFSCRQLISDWSRLSLVAPADSPTPAPQCPAVCDVGQLKAFEARAQGLCGELGLGVGVMTKGWMETHQ